jgi:cell division protein FtsI (penicillin-binding protein 3)
MSRVVQLQARDHLAWTKLAQKQNSTALEIQGARGTIYDRNGRPLAVSVEGVAVGFRPKAFDLDKLPLLEQALAIPRKEINLSAKFSWLGRGVPRGKVEMLEKLRGIDLFPEFYRHYPQGELARGLIGQVSLEGRGTAGLELRFEEMLAAKKERIRLQRDARGRLLDAPQESLEGLFIEEAQAVSQGAIRDEGGDLHLSIDSSLQGILEDELEKGRIAAKAKRVVGVVMRAETGELLALGQAIAGVSKKGKFLSPEELRNPIVQDIFEPGSTFKPLVVALAMDQRKTTENELINCENGNYPVGKYVIHDVHPVATVSTREVLVRSSNIGTAKIGARLGKDGLKAGIEKLGFGKATGVELPGEQRGLLQRGSWGAIQIATTSFGQGISATPLQMVRAYAALANGGRLVRPTILKVASPDRLEAPQVFTRKTAETITDILTGVTESKEGTGRKAAIEGLRVSGKTGTAQKPKVNGKGYSTDKVFSSFIGYIDLSSLGSSEHLVMFVGVDEPGVHPRWGGTVAAPVFKSTMERILAHQMAGR